jgi:hypothetical protein
MLLSARDSCLDGIGVFRVDAVSAVDAISGDKDILAGGPVIAGDIVFTGHGIAASCSVIKVVMVKEFT